MPFNPVTSRVSFPEQEERILDFWKRHDVFKRSVEERPADNVFSFFEGPPTANGNPGIHHVLARVFKDLVPRYRTMRGYRVPRKGGWDTHGLPVELEVERSLGFSGKPDIEAYGVEAFNEKCRESVFKYVSEWERMTDRIGFWIDTEHAYVTYHPEYVESCWWIFKTLFENNLMFRDFRVTPHCPRCQTSLSSHEIALGYKEDTPDPGVTLRFRLPDPATTGRLVPPELRLEDGVATSLLAWTTTPWTLSGNTALAVLPEATYALVEREDAHLGKERVVVAEPRVASTVADGEVIGTFPGTTLVDLRYEALYAESTAWVEPLMFVEGRTQKPKSVEDLPDRRVIASDHVTTDEGTGILHVAPAFGEDDYGMGRAEGLMFLQPVRLDGTLIGGPGDGLFAKVADQPITQDLRERGLLFRSETIRHTYPFCWRCDTPVLYYAKPSWYIRTTAVARDMVAGNQRIHWVPEHIKDGRFGEWLEGNIDWAVSRERYWGTPLPIWVCELCEHTEVIGAYDELFARARAGTADGVRKADGTIDAHRPFIDRVELDCPQCNGTMRRTPEVADAWFDSGAMPYAQFHYPFEQNEFMSRFPADFICEAVDQTRGWFYTLHALATLLNHTEDVPEAIAYRNVVCLGLILDGEGQKMSKSRGNVVDPWSVLNAHGADAIRWYMYTASPPGNSRRFSTDLVAETSRRFLSTLWNTYSFFVTYANSAGFDPSGAKPDASAYSELDRWIRSELHQTVRRVTDALEAYEPSEAARPIEAFVEQLSNWYVRRSRSRFRQGGADSNAAQHTLYECLVTVSKLLAPFTPFIAEELYRNLVAERVSGTADSVHLAMWPEVDEAAIDEQLSSDIALVQRMVSLGRATRAKAQTKVRQPLASAVLVPRTEAERGALTRLADQIAEELNVKAVEVITDPGDRLAYTIRPNLPVLGPRFGADVGKVRGWLMVRDPAEVARAMRAGQPIELTSEISLGPTDVLVSVEAAEGWAAQEESGYAALVDTTVTPELEAEGLAREIVRRLQDLRREAGLDVGDRIRVTYRAAEPVASALATHAASIAEDTLASSFEAVAEPAGEARSVEDVDGAEVVLALSRV